MRAFFYALVGVITATVAGCATSGHSSGSDGGVHEVHPQVSIRRTTEGIPEIQAQNWPSLGYGIGYVQAQDNLCTLAEAFVTYRGDRSRYFGPDAKPDWHATIGHVSNLDSDFFFKFLDDDETVKKYKQAQPAELTSLVDGFVQGYNTYLRTLQAAAFASANLACRGQAWVRPISASDVYRRLYAANLVGGYLNFMHEIVTARPPTRGISQVTRPSEESHSPARHSMLQARARALAMQFRVGETPGVGSNGIALGSQATGMSGGLLLGNPHWYWAGPDRFYQARLTIPGKLDVAGVSFLGIPVIMIGFNRNVAWTHTVSTARRFGLFQLTLTPGDLISYQLDGKAVPMTAVPVSVQVRQPDGSIKTISRTFYNTQYGPIVNLSDQAPAMGWSARTAIALRDINAANFRIFESFLAWDQADSLDTFITDQKHAAAMPWVNTLAIGRHDGRAWYADIGAVPGVPDDLVAACTTPMGKAFDKEVPGVPFLDGSRSACDWRTMPGAVQAGAMPPQAMPQLARTDFVANMNNSAELANPQAPLRGFPAVFGPTGGSPGLRARLGYAIAQDLARQGQGGTSLETLTQTLKARALDGLSMSASLFKQPLLDAVCRLPYLRVTRDVASGRRLIPSRPVSTAQPCDVLRRWNNMASGRAEGANLWDAIWARLVRIPAGRLYAQPFDPADPLGTPAGLNPRDPDLAQAFGAAVLSVEDTGRALDAPRAKALFVDMGTGQHIALPGGCDQDGYFTAACLAWGTPLDGDIRPRDLLGNSYLQVVNFAGGDAHADTLLAAGESDDPASPYYAGATQRYAAQAWTSWSLSDSKDLGTQWRAYRASPQYDGDARDASEYLGTTEVQLLATELGPDVVLLKNSPQDILRLFDTATKWGQALSVMRNEYGISEREVVLNQVQVRTAASGELDLAGPLRARIFPSRWKYVFSVIHYYGSDHVAVRSLQAYDQYGNSIVKLILHSDADNAAFDRLTRDMRADRQVIDPTQPRVFVSEEQAKASAASLQTAVRQARTPAEVETLLEDIPFAAHERLWKYWPVGDVRTLDASVVRALATELVASREPVLATVDNGGMVQHYVGRISQAKSIGMGWYSFLGEGIALHVHEPDIASGRAIRFHTAAGDVTVVEFIDTAGAVAMRFVDAPPAGEGESPIWRELAAGLPVSFF